VRGPANDPPLQRGPTGDPADRALGTAIAAGPASASDERDDPGRGQSPGHDAEPRRWMALAVCFLAGFMTLLDISIVNVALPSIRTGLSATPSTLQWITAGYSLAFGLSLVPAGRAGDARSRRLVFAVGVALFTLASAFAGAAPSSGWLVGARIVQGLAGGIVSPQIAGFIQVLFSGRERGKAFGLFGAVVGVSTAIGPLAGGALIAAAGTHDGWRWIFYINVPIGAVTLWLARRYLPRGSMHTERRASLDLPGVLVFAAAMYAVLWPFVEGDQRSLAARPWWLEGLAAVLLAIFVLREAALARRGGEPMVDLRLFRLRSYSFGTTLAGVYFAGFTPLFLVLTVYLQVGLGYSALLAGLTALPFAIGSGAAAGIGGRHVARFGRAQVVAGLCLVVIGLLAMFAVTGHVRHDVGWALLLPLLVAGIGSGTVIAPNQTVTLGEVPRWGSGSAAGVLQTSQRVGSAVGIAAVSALFFADITQAGVLRADTSPHAFEVYAHALRVSILGCLGFVAVAGIVGIADLLSHRGGADRSGSAMSGSAGR